MANGTQKRTRQQRVASVELPPGAWKSIWATLQRGSVLLRLAICLAVACFLCVYVRAWDPPFAYREGTTPFRNVVARVDFEQFDPDATREAKEDARQLAIAVYNQDSKQIEQLRAQLLSEIGTLLSADSLAEVDQEIWSHFTPKLAAGTPDPTPEQEQQRFEQFKAYFAEENALEDFSKHLTEALAPLQQWGALDGLPKDHDANTVSIEIRREGDEGFGAQREVASVLLNGVTGRLQESLNKLLGSNHKLASQVFAWLQPRIKSTLTLNVVETRTAQDRAAAETPDETKKYHAGEDVLAFAGELLANEDIKLLRLEHSALLESRRLRDRLPRTAAFLGMFGALYTLCGFYSMRRDPSAINDLLRFCMLQVLLILAVVVAVTVRGESWNVENIPLLLFGMIVAIAYQQETALVMSLCVALVIVVALGQGFPQAVVLTATVTGAVLTLGQVRTRSKLLLVGFAAACVGFLTTLGVGTLFGQPAAALLRDAGAVALWSIIAGSLMTVLLPAVEKGFGVQTDLSLIELGDPAHPLLQELIRRAPGTYNHSITVASLAEAAAESIGARSLLVRVGAYFHDIGKMLKPGYFIENQRQGDNRHDALVPAMSTLVIIAHVKDGADLARQNKLPESIIDFIQQHHGTTLVEYFYRQASQKQSQEDPGSSVDESSFRYPGPKPQSREAGVLMLADAVESASRVLKEPTPSRIENLVEEISMKRLLDGQFDESGLTLEEVRKIGESLVKSLTAVYHGRVKYPSQETA